MPQFSPKKLTLRQITEEASRMSLRELKATRRYLDDRLSSLLPTVRRDTWVPASKAINKYLEKRE